MIEEIDYIVKIDCLLSRLFISSKQLFLLYIVTNIIFFESSIRKHKETHFKHLSTID